jgi:hypothetical protein
VQYKRRENIREARNLGSKTALRMPAIRDPGNANKKGASTWWPARGPISFREAAHNQFFTVPAQISRTYFGAVNMMRQSEQQDIEQLKDIPER